MDLKVMGCRCTPPIRSHGVVIS